MKVLLINVCGTEGIVAVAEGSRVLAEERLLERAASEGLIAAVRKLMEEQAWSVKDLGAVGVVVGPGSFTGVRVGLSAAKGLCEAGEVGMVAMSRLALIAGVDGMGVLDAGRGEYYCGVYRAGAVVVEELLPGEEVRAALQHGDAATCEDRVAAALPGIRVVREPGAEEMLAVVRQRVAAGAWSDVATADANYLRRTDAELLVKGTRVRP